MHFQKKKKKKKKDYINFEIGSPTIVKSNILVRSMGPFSEHRMVSFRIENIQIFLPLIKPCHRDRITQWTATSDR